MHDEGMIRSAAPPQVRIHAKPLVEMTPHLHTRLRDFCTLVPNRRYARALEESYHHWQLAHGQRTWARPTIRPFSGFVLEEAERMLATTGSGLRILTPAMQRAAFLKVAPEGIRGPQNWYQEVARAWHLTHQYAIETPEDAHLETNNTLIFENWAEAFRAFTEAHGYLTESELVACLSGALDAGSWAPEQPVFLWGFSAAHPPTPRESELLERLGRRGLIVDRLTPARVRRAKTPRIAQFEQPEDELCAIALWARGLLEQATEPVSIGIAFPGLSHRRHQVERQLLNTLYPLGETHPDEPRLFDIAGGIPLTQASVCESALQLLNLIYRDVSIHALDRLFESPFLQMGAPLPLSSEARRRLPTRIRARDLYASRRSALPDALQMYSHSKRRTRTLSAWLAEFQKVLEIARWPQSHTLDSLTYQHTTQFVRLFNEIEPCSHFLGRMRAADAVLELARAAELRHHEVQRSGAPIRVLDIEELVNLRFTHLWVGGMRNADWPVSISANPFLSRLAQRRANVPGVTPELRLSDARGITSALPGVAKDVVFSHSQFDGDEQHRPSTLLPKAHLKPANAFVSPDRQALLHFSHPFFQQPPVALDQFVDEIAPACEISERQGNAELVKDQSNCPFRAFARHRLLLGQASDPTELLDARAIGSAIHLALELAYREISSQASIKRNSRPKSLANRSAQQALQTTMPSLPRSVQTGLERMLAEIVAHWFACDLQRPPFADLHTEQEIELELEGMLLRLKIDRFDQDLETRAWVITDYKSSPPPVSSLRIQAGAHEPQLLLYAEALRHARRIEPVSLAFGAVGEPGRVGYAHCSRDARFRKQSRERAADGWVLDHAGEVVRRLIAEYLAGQASVTPRKRACETCHLQSLCRIHSLDES